ncbi:peptide deformylase [Anaerocolumna cellulosilytica]|uniref:Peptide deformylase n=1 Tax=Anaerocolumna cellulosilytica TaxID=433286 RepID=A0A6S6R5E4_9FIRM|nr:peptide deformylase [Anaerocolumna cellulosilytica]MBB5197104.1 peptide deformylase [Anaerocolumna cellulosilytica]BCJ95317.1 peptide deformylase [Anaerocolumna cellulosilytica]
MALRLIRLNDDPTLRKKCRPVEIVDDKIRQLLDDMAETMYDADFSEGLSAPQIGVLKRLVVIDMGQGLIKLVNPVIVEKTGTQVVTEGCLSLPGTWGNLERPSKIVVNALDENGKEITLTATGDMAKCLCHEIDHLDGVLFTDFVTEYLD